MARVRVVSTAQAIGDELAMRLLSAIELARNEGRRFLLGCPTGRTPRPIYDAMAAKLARRRQDISNVVLVMMDEYVVAEESGFRYADSHNPWSCHHFARVEILQRWNEALPQSRQLPAGSLWFPDPKHPAEYDKRIAEAGGVDFFLLASGASDGHVAFNPPGSSRDSGTRIIELSAETRNDNLKTFPDFGTLEAVPKHGVSVGLGTIASAREAVMVVWGAAKRMTLRRIREAKGHEADWPATIIHECRNAVVLCDKDAAAANEGDPA